MANNLDPDETPHSAASHLGLHCLPKPGRSNTYSKVQYMVRVMLRQTGKIMTKSCDYLSIIDRNDRTDNRLSFQL